MSTHEKLIELTPAWDKRHPDPNKDYGIHGVELKMVLKGPEGAVQFVVYTNWLLPHVREEQDARFLASPNEVGLHIRHPLPADVGYHSLYPMYEGQTSATDECPYLNGRPCYYDGSGLRAQEWFEEKLLPGGSDAIWAALEEAYDNYFTRFEAA